jgi:uncharacterized caspase-like protein/WD40 repeat protein
LSVPGHPPSLYERDATALSADGSVAALCTEQKRFGRKAVVVVTGLRKNPTAKVIGGASSPHNCLVKLSPDGSVVYLASDRGLEAWSIATGKRIWHTPGLPGGFDAMSISQDGARIVVGSRVATVVDARSGLRLGELGWPVPFKARVLFKGSKRLIAVGVGEPGMMQLATPDVSGIGDTTPWNLESGRRDGLGLVYGDDHVMPNGQVRVFERVPNIVKNRCKPDELYVRVAQTRLSALSSSPWWLWYRRPGMPNVVPPSSRKWPPKPGVDFLTCVKKPAKGANWRGQDLVHGRYLASVKKKKHQNVGEWFVGSYLRGLPRKLQRFPKGFTVQFSPNGRWIFGTPRFFGDGSLLDVWDSATGRKLGVFGARPGKPRGPFVITARDHSAADGWGVWRVATSRNESLIAIGDGLDVTVRDVVHGKMLRHLALPAGDGHSYLTSLAFGQRSDATLFVGMSDGRMLVYHGDQLVAQGTSSGGAIRRVDVRADDARVATISDDGAIRLWNGETGEQIAALMDFEDGEWAIVTPRGAYTGTPEVNDRVAWVFDHPTEAFPFEQFASQALRPDIVRRRLAGEDVDLPAPVRRPPAVHVSRASVLDPKTGEAQVCVDVTGDAKKVDVFDDGRPVYSGSVASTPTTLDLDVHLLPGRSVASARAFDASGIASNPSLLDVATPVLERTRPDLWVFAFGVNHYPNLAQAYQLGAADADAQSIAQVFRVRAGPGKLFAKAHVTVLTDEQVTPASVKAALVDLTRMRPSDLAVVFFAGHGARPKPTSDMLYLTSQVSATVPSIEKYGVGWRDIGKSLDAAKGRVLVLLDACHSGHFTQGLTVRNGAMAASLTASGHAGVVVFSAAKGRQFSLEGDMARSLHLDAKSARLVGAASHSDHGFFTGAILKSLNNPATDTNGDGVIELSELIRAVTLRVGEASSGKQTPWVARSDMFGDFPVAATPRP